MLLIEVMEDVSGAKLTIKQCAACRTYWRVVMDQVTSDDGDIIESESYHALTVGQAEALLDDAASNIVVSPSMPVLQYPDCCRRPNLQDVRVLGHAHISKVAINRCDACETYWSVSRTRWAVWMGEVGPLITFLRLTTDEVTDLLVEPK